MQNKYKVEAYTQLQVLGAVKGYENYKRQYRQACDEIFSFGSKNFSEHYNSLTKSIERVYISGGGGSSDQTADKAMRLEALENSHAYKVVKAVELANEVMTAELSGKKTFAERKKIIEKLYESCKYGRHFNFDYSGINSISRPQFYRYRQRYIYIIAEELNYLSK